MIEKVVDKIFEAVEGLRPPHPLDNGERDLVEKTQIYDVKVRAWRYRVARWLTIHGAIIVFMLWAMFRGIPMIGQIAWGNDVDNRIKGAVSQLEAKINTIDEATKEIQRKQKEREIEDMRRELFNLRVQQCKAHADKNKNNPYTESLQRLRDRWFSLVGYVYEPANCEDL